MGLQLQGREPVRKALPSYADRAPKNRTQRRALDLATRDEPAFMRAYRRWARALIDDETAARLTDALRRGVRPSAAALVVPPFDVRDPGAVEAWARLARDLSAAYRAALEHTGQATADALPGGSFTFRVAKAKRESIAVPPNPRSLQWIREHGGELITSISNEQRGFIARRIERGYAKGERPEDMVASIRRQIGLTDRQADSVERRREAAVEAGMSDAAADSIAERYADQSLDARATAIARTENKAAQSQGQQDAWSTAMDEGLLPAKTRKRWVSMPESDRLSDICRELDGQVVDLNDPFFSEVLGELVFAPPAHPNCLPGDALVSTRHRVAAKTERWYEGDLVIVRTTGGKQLSCTPNHPIGTSRGWIAAKLLRPGDHVLCGRLADGRAPRVMDNEDDRPPSLEKIAGLSLVQGEAPPLLVPIAAEHFHGDGFGSQIAIVRTDRYLRGQAHTRILEQPPHFGFKRRFAGPAKLLGARPGLLDGHRILGSSARLVSGQCKLRAIGRRCLTHPLVHRSAAVPRVDSSILQSTRHQRTADTEGFGQRFHALSGEVTTDKIVYVDAHVFCGHVFNLETATGFYVANGIVTHNCRSTVVLDFSEV